MNLIRKHLNALLAAAVLTLGLASLAEAQMISVNNASGQVTQLGANLTPQAGETACTMAPALASTVYANQPNGGLVVQQFSPTPCTAATVIATPAQPTPTATPTSAGLAAGANAGTSPPSPGCVAGAICTNQRGALQFGTGTSPAAGSMLVATFAGGGYSTPPAVTLMPLNSATASLNLYVNITSTSVTVLSANAPAASQAATTYKFVYLVTP